MSHALETDVLIVGAGPSGMVSALCLARAGVRSIIVERAAGISTHPKAHEVNARSIEILTSLGLSLQELEAEASPPADAARIVFCKTVGEELGRIDLLAPENHPEKYRRHVRAAQPYLNLSQTELEKILLERVRGARETRVLFDHQWEALEEAGESIRSTVRRRSDDVTIEVSSRYVVGADGAASRVRQSLGIAMEGPEKLQDFVNAYFELNLSQHVTTPAKLYWVLHPEATGTLIAHHVEKRWVYHVPIYAPHERAEDYTADVFTERIRKAIGDDDAQVRIRSISFWRMTAQVARSFQKGRVFLVGDAAHRFPPTGGLGMNTGIADAHNLAWKLAAALDGRAPETLLDTYEDERRPIAARNCEESHRNFEKIFEVVEALGLPPNGLQVLARVKGSALFRWLPSALQTLLLRVLWWPAFRALARVDARDDTRRKVQGAIAHQTPHFDRIGLDIGYAYERGAIVSDGTPPIALEDPVSSYEPSTRPGARFPHLWLDDDHTRSTHDILDSTGYTLLLGDEGSGWKAALQQLSLCSRFTVHSLGAICGNDRRQRELETVCAIEADGALLIRPDGHVAWRAQRLTESPAQTLERVLERCYVR